MPLHSHDISRVIQCTNTRTNMKTSPRAGYKEYPSRINASAAGSKGGVTITGGNDFSRTRDPKRSKSFDEDIPKLEVEHHKLRPNLGTYTTSVIIIIVPTYTVEVCKAGRRLRSRVFFQRGYTVRLARNTVSCRRASGTAGCSRSPQHRPATCRVLAPCSLHTASTTTTSSTFLVT